MEENLAADVQAAITEIVGSDQVISSTKFHKTTIQIPTGDSGSRAWSELWVFNPVSLNGQLFISIKEQNQYLTEIEIKTYDDNVRRFVFDKRD